MLHQHTPNSGIAYFVGGICVPFLFIVIKYILRRYFNDKSKVWDWITPPEYSTRSGKKIYAVKNPKLKQNQFRAVIFSSLFVSLLCLGSIVTAEKVDTVWACTFSLIPITLGIISLPLWSSVKPSSISRILVVLYIVLAIGFASFFMGALYVNEVISAGIIYTWSIIPIALGILSIPLWAKVKYPSLCILAAVLYVITSIGLLFVIDDLNSKAYPLPHFACKLIGQDHCNHERSVL